VSDLEKALAVVRAAGYRVSKPRASKKRDRVGPTFVAEFADGEVTRMSTYTSLEKLDWQRGVRLAQVAYQSRTGNYPPPIIAGRFEQDGAVLATYDRPSKWTGTGESCELNIARKSAA
jgi:hypothetical protein